jgi:hypothetical protein
MTRRSSLVGSLVSLAVSLVAVAACSSDDAPGESPDGGGADAGPIAPSRCNFDESVQWDLLGETLQVQSADGGTCLAIERRNDCPADSICKAVPFTVLEARIGHAGTVVTQTESAAMAWHATHHNWLDTADLDLDGVRYHLTFTYGETSVYTVEARRGPTVLWGPVTLAPVNPR